MSRYRMADVAMSLWPWLVDIFTFHILSPLKRKVWQQTMHLMVLVSGFFAPLRYAPWRESVRCHRESWV